MRWRLERIRKKAARMGLKCGYEDPFHRQPDDVLGILAYRMGYDEGLAERRRIATEHAERKPRTQP
jgi:alanine racemase